MPYDSDIPALLGGVAIRPAGPPAWPRADAGIRAALEQCAESGNWGLYHGENVRNLIQRLAELHEARHVLLCSSGTAAVELALRGLQIAAGDEVILCGYDYKGNFLNILTVGARPVLVDVDPQTGQLDPERVSAAISSRTRAVIASHLHGGVVDMPALRQVAAPHGLPIVEDACQMPGASLFDRRAGMWGDVGVISFGGSKLLSAGRGGALLTNRDDVAARIRRHAWRGNDAYPLSELQAAVLLPQLEELDARRAVRNRNVARLMARLSEFPALTPLGVPAPGIEPDFYKLGFRYHPAACGGLSREVFAAAMRAEGIAVSPGFRALHVIHARSRFRAGDDLGEASRADAEWLVLHHPVLLEGDAALNEILAALTKVRTHADRLCAVNVPRESIVGLWESET